MCGTSAPRSVPNVWDEPVWACRACRSAFVHPTPDEDELRERYQGEHREGKWVEVFREASEEQVAGRVRLVHRLHGGRAGSVLDVGCGDGRYLQAAAATGWRGVGLELAQEVAREARDRIGSGRVAVATLQAIDARGHFDAVTFWDVLEHVADPLGMLRDARDRLRPGGLVAATMPNHHGVTRFLHGVRWSYYDLARYGHLFHLSLEGLESLVRRAGLEVVHGVTEGSVDLRDVPAARGGTAPGPVVTAVLDRASGLLARIAEPLGLGNTLTVVGRRP